MSDRVAFITGGASGIGAAFARELARQGSQVVLADRQVDMAEEVAAEIRREGGEATAVELDVRDAAQFQQVIDDTVSRTGRIDCLFNNAGIGVGGPALGYTLPDWYVQSRLGGGLLQFCYRRYQRQSSCRRPRRSAPGT